MNESTGGVLNTTLVRDYVCAQCHSALVEKFVEGDGWVVVCAQPEPCQPGGFCTAKHAEREESRSLEDYQEASANYPELAQAVELTQDERRAMKRKLFGED